MSLTLDATNPGPWPAATAAVLADQATQHRYIVGVPDLENIDAHDVELTVDANASPIARLTFKARVTDTEYFNYLHPFNTPWVTLQTGYEINGVTSYATLFYGLITSAVRKGGVVTVTAQSAEAAYDHPARGLYNVADTYTSIAQVVAALNSGSKVYRQLYSTAAGLDTPTSGQLSAFRVMELQAGDNLDDWLRSVGDCLGQWVRGDYRNKAAAVGFNGAYYITPRPASWIPLNLSGLILDMESALDLAYYYNVLNFTAEWVASGETKTARYVYASSDAIDNGPPIIAKDVTVKMKPPGGTLTSTNPTALQWLANAITTATYTIEARAVWWLDVGFKITHPSSDTDPESFAMTTQIRRIVFHVDAGTMTLTTA